MDINGSARFRHRKSPSSDRFLGAFSPTPPRHDGSLLNSSAAEDTELNEDDIFSTGDFSAESSRNHHSQQQKQYLTHNNNHHIHTTSPSSSASSSPRLKSFPAQSDSFGILAALPENKPGSHHHLYQKTALSSSPSSTASSSSNSSSRLIPSIPKPPQDRLPASSSFSKHHHHPQSAPVNVPVLSKAMRRRDREIDEIDEDEDEDDGEMLPPHEIVARSQTPDVAFSVLEGVGRTLKGRDLRQIFVAGVFVFGCIRLSSTLRKNRGS